MDPTSLQGAVRAVLAPFSLQEFLAERHLKRPLYVAGEPAKFHGLLAAARLLQDLRAGLLRAERIKAGFRDARGNHRELTIRAAEADEALAAGMTVMVPRLEDDYPQVALLLRRFRTELGIADALNASAFISPDGSGYGLHYDNASVFTMQLAGAKRWRISPTPTVEFPRRELVPTREELEAGMHPFDPATLVDHVLGPGDFLYLPPGTWHDVRAEGLSVHLGIAHVYEPLTGLFVDALRERLDDSPWWRHVPVRAPAATPAELRDARRAVVAARLRELQAAVLALDGDAIADALQDRIDHGPREDAATSAATAPHTLGLDTPLRCDAAILTTALDPARDDDESLCLYRRGSLFATLPRAAAEVFDIIQTTTTFTPRALLAAAGELAIDDLLGILQQLVDAGVLGHDHG